MDGGSAPLPKREDEIAADAFRSVFPNGLPPARPSAGTAIVRTFPLSEEHVAKLVANNAAGNVLGVESAQLKRVSNSHRRLAQFLAMGMDEGKAGILCNYALSTISILKSDPLFQELLTYYGRQVDAEFVSVAQKMAELHDDVVDELRQRLEESPQQFSVGILSDLMTRLSDRTGYGPTSNLNMRTTTVSLNGDDLKRIKSDAVQEPRPADGQVRKLTAEDRATLDGVFTLTANDVAPGPGTQGLIAGERVGVRAEDPGVVEAGAAGNSVAASSVD